jgi:hypothetical protein
MDAEARTSGATADVVTNTMMLAAGVAVTEHAVIDAH